MSWRVALRLARREVRRRPGRGVLVALLVAIPVLGMTLAVVLVRTESRSAEDRFVRNYGDVHAVFDGSFSDAVPVTDLDPEPVAQNGGVPDHVVTVGLPAGSESQAVRRTWSLNLEGPSAGSAPEWVGASDDPLDGPFGGRYTLVEGSPPESAGEVALTRRGARAFGASIGDEVTLVPEASDRRAPGARLPATVVGLVEDRYLLSDRHLLMHPDQPLPVGVPEPRLEHRVHLPEDVSGDELVRLAAAGAELRPGLSQDAQRRLLDEAIAAGSLPAGSSWDDLRLLDTPGEIDTVIALDQHRRSSESVAAGVGWSLVIGAVVLTAAGIVISAAFAVGARRQLTAMGLLSASGGSPRLLKRTLALQGTLNGVAGIALGWLFAAVLLGLGRGLIERMMDRRLPAWNVHLLDLAAIAGVALLAATIAALVPARNAAQIPTLAALAGRRPLPPVRRGLTASGVALVVVGLALLAVAFLGAKVSERASESMGHFWPLVAVVGGMLQLLGACAVTPAVAGSLERLGGRLRGPWRLGVRSLARHRTRTGAVVAAVAAVIAVAVVAGGLARSFEERDRVEWYYSLPSDVALIYAEPSYSDVSVGGELQDTISPPSDAASETIDGAIPGSEQLTIQAGVVEGHSQEQWVIQTDWEHGTAHFGPVIADPELLDSLDVDGSVHELLDRAGLVHLTWSSDDDPTGALAVSTPDGREVTASVTNEREVPSDLGNLLISPALAEDLELVRQDLATVVHAPAPLTGEQLDTLRSVLYSDEASSGQYIVRHGSDRSSGPTQLQLEMLLAMVALLVALFVIATSLALAAAESRDEREVLTMVGTRPRDLAWSAGAKAAILAGLGGLLAVPLGLAPLAVIAWSVDKLAFRPPWSTLGVLVVAVPFLAAVVAMGSSAIAQRVRPIRVSSATFE